MKPVNIYNMFINKHLHISSPIKMPRNYRTKYTTARYDVVGCDPYDTYERWDMGIEPICSAEEDAFDAFDETYLQRACQTRIYERCKRKGHIPSSAEITEFVEAASNVVFPTCAKYQTNWYRFNVAINPDGHLAPILDKYPYWDWDGDYFEISVLCSSCFDKDNYEWNMTHKYDAYCCNPSCRVRAGWKVHAIEINYDSISFGVVDNLLEYIGQIIRNKKTTKALLATATKLRHRILCCVANGLPTSFIPLTIGYKPETVEKYCERYNEELSLKGAIQIELDEYLKYRGEAMSDYWMATRGTPCNPSLLT